MWQGSNKSLLGIADSMSLLLLPVIEMPFPCHPDPPAVGVAAVRIWSVGSSSLVTTCTQRTQAFLPA